MRAFVFSCLSCFFPHTLHKKNYNWNRVVFDTCSTQGLKSDNQFCFWFFRKKSLFLFDIFFIFYFLVHTLFRNQMKSQFVVVDSKTSTKVQRKTWYLHFYSKYTIEKENWKNVPAQIEKLKKKTFVRARSLHSFRHNSIKTIHISFNYMNRRHIHAWYDVSGFAVGGKVTA